jgi:hypothetical protein
MAAGGRYLGISETNCCVEFLRHLDNGYQLKSISAERSVFPRRTKLGQVRAGKVNQTQEERAMYARSYVYDLLIY